MKKRNIMILVVIIGVTVLAGVFLLLKFNHKEEVSDALKFSKEYEITEDNIFVYRNANQIINILKRGTGVVYLGFPECPWCKAYVPILNEIAKESGIEKIYYFNIKEDRSNNTEEYKKILEILSGNLLYDEEGNERIYVPDVTVVINGDIVGHNNDTSVIKEDITPKEYWTEENKNKLKEQLKSYFEEIKHISCNDICDR